MRILLAAGCLCLCTGAALAATPGERWLVQSREALDLQQLPRAVTLAERAAHSLSQPSEARAVQARAWLAEGDWAKATNLLNKLERSRSLDFYLLRGDVLAQRHQGKLAVQNLEAALELAGKGPRRWECAIELADAYAGTKHYAQAHQALQAVYRSPGVAASPFWSASLCLTEATLLQLEHREDDAWLLLMQAEAQYRSLGAAAGLSKVAAVRASLLAERDPAGALKQRWDSLAGLGSDLIFAHLDGLEKLLSQIPVQDAAGHARLLNELQRLYPTTTGVARLRTAILLMQACIRRPSTWGEVDRLCDRMEATPDDSLRMLALRWRVILRAHQNRASECEGLLQQDLAYSRRLHTDLYDPVLGNCSEVALLRSLGEVQMQLGRLDKAVPTFALDLSLAPFDDDSLWRFVARSGQIEALVEALRVREAAASVQDGLKEVDGLAEAQDRATGYFGIFSAFLRDLDTHLLAVTPVRLAPDSPGALGLRYLGRDAKLQARFLSAMDGWIAGERKENDPSGVARALLTKGVMLGCWDRPVEATDTYEQACAVAPDQDRPVKATVLLLLARELVGEGKLSEAIAVQQQAARLAPNGPGNNIPQLFPEILALMLSRAGRFPEALAIARTSLKEARALGPGAEWPAHYVLARVLEDRGSNALQELAAATALLGPGHPAEEVMLLRMQARLEEKAGHPSDGLTCLERALRLRRVADLPEIALQASAMATRNHQSERALALLLEALQSLRGLYQELPSEMVQGLSREGSLSHLVEQAIELCQQLHRPADAARVISFWRAVELAPAATAGLPQSDRELLESQRQRVATLARSSGPESEKQLAEVRQQLLATLNRVRQENPDYESLVGVGDDDLLQLQPRLAPDTVVVQYYPGESSLYLQVLTAQGVEMRQLRVPRERIFNLVKAWREQLEQPTAGKPEVGEQLYRILLEPIADLLASHPRVLVLPAGELWYLPLESLPVAGHFFGRDHNLAYLSAADVRSYLMPVSAGTGGQVVALGAPQGVDLPATSAEVARVAAAFPGTVTLLGDRARSDTLRQAAPGARILHIATHGHTEGDDLNASFLQLADGPLHLADVYAWRLRPGALVVLSSCLSGYGRTDPGREVTSMASAFHAAGARAVICSLWRVDDEATSALFSQFYAALAHGSAPGEALRQSQESLIKSARWASPYYWSGFVLQGDPR